MITTLSENGLTVLLLVNSLYLRIRKPLYLINLYLAEIIAFSCLSKLARCLVDNSSKFDFVIVTLTSHAPLFTRINSVERDKMRASCSTNSTFVSTGINCQY